MSWMLVSDIEDRYREWTAPPGKPPRYAIAQMVADAHHGWRDGRKTIPKITEAGEGDCVETPRLKFLCRRGELQIREEWIVHHREMTLLTQRLVAASGRAGVLARMVEQSTARMDDVRKPPGPAELDERRTAEADQDARPMALVRARRMADHQRRLRAAETEHLQAQQQFAEAMREVLALADLVQRRTSVTRIRVQRIYDHTWRRIAVYWQRLIRVHKDGAELNARLAPLGPKLPTWARDDTDHDRLDVEGEE